MSVIVDVMHAILAGVWLGGVIFTTAVVSPALRAMKWPEHERVSVRSKIGKQYARVGSINLALLFVFAVLDGLLMGFGTALYVEYLLLTILLGLVAVHGAYFGRTLAGLAEAERRARNEDEARALAERAGNFRSSPRGSRGRISWSAWRSRRSPPCSRGFSFSVEDPITSHRAAPVGTRFIPGSQRPRWTFVRIWVANGAAASA